MDGGNIGIYGSSSLTGGWGGGVLGAHLGKERCNFILKVEYSPSQYRERAHQTCQKQPWKFQPYPLKIKRLDQSKGLYHCPFSGSRIPPIFGRMWLKMFSPKMSQKRGRGAAEFITHPNGNTEILYNTDSSPSCSCADSQDL